MYALFPAFVSSLFLFCGVCVVTTHDRTRASLAFLGVTTLTCLWQGIWVFLFQTQDVGAAQVLAKLGWIAILIIPTILYHLAVEVAEAPSKWHWFLAVYALDAALAGLLPITNLVVDGVHQFHSSFYPKTGVLETAHIAQTAALVSCSMWVLYREQRHATAEKRKRLLTPLFGVGLAPLAVTDYTVNYGVAFYSPGVLPLAAALGIIVVDVVKLDLTRLYVLAATVVHEARMPSTTIRLRAAEIARVQPDVYRGYLLAIDNGLCQPPQHPAMFNRLSELTEATMSEVTPAYGVIKMALASATLERFDQRTFVIHSLRECVETAMVQYPFQTGEHERMHMQMFNADQRFTDSDTLLACVLFNLPKNAPHVIQTTCKGHVEISARWDGDSYVLMVCDSATSTPLSMQRRISDPSFSTRHVDEGPGMGLTLCRRAMQVFGGRIQYESVVGECTLFSVRFLRPPAI